MRETAKAEGLTWRSFFAGGGTGGPIATRWGIRGWPTMLVLDAKGLIRARGVEGAPADGTKQRER